MPALTSVRPAAQAVANGCAVVCSVFGKLLGSTVEEDSSSDWAKVTSSYINATIARQVGGLRNFRAPFEAADHVGDQKLPGTYLS